MSKRWINTKVEFIWDGSQYVEQSSEGYWYDGEMALCAVNEVTANSDDWGWKFTNTYGDDSIVHLAHSGAHGVHIRANDATASTYLLEMGADNSFGIDTKFIVLGNGNLGIGVASPAELLHIKNSSNNWNEYAKIRIGTELSDLYACEIGFHRGTDSNDDRGFFIDGAGNGAQHLKVLHTGLVGIGTVEPTELLEIAGSSDVKIRFLETGVSDSYVMLDASEDWFGISSNGAQFDLGVNTASG